MTVIPRAHDDNIGANKTCSNYRWLTAIKVDIKHLMRRCKLLTNLTPGSLDKGKRNAQGMRPGGGGGGPEKKGGTRFVIVSSRSTHESFLGVVYV